MADIDDDLDAEVFGITDRTVADVLNAVMQGDAAAIDALLDPLHPADIAHLIEQIDSRERRDLLTLWQGGIDGDILSELDENLREEIIQQLRPDELATALRDLDSDDVVDLVEYLGEDQQEAVLDALDASDRVVVEQALSYPEESAGRHMQSELVRAPNTGPWARRLITCARTWCCRTSFIISYWSIHGSRLWAMSRWAVSSAMHAPRPCAI
jgi:Mg/Co/Ni transporter MgtE (contains CBS domain)